MSFRARRGGARREPSVAQAPIDLDEDDAGVVVRKTRLPKERPKRTVNVADLSDARPAGGATVATTGLYSNGGLDQLKKDQSRITVGYRSVISGFLVILSYFYLIRCVEHICWFWFDRVAADSIFGSAQPDSFGGIHRSRETAASEAARARWTAAIHSFRKRRPCLRCRSTNHVSVHSVFSLTIHPNILQGACTAKHPVPRHLFARKTTTTSLT